MRILIALFLFTSLVAKAEVSLSVIDQSDSLVQQALQQSLYKDSYWLALIHYKPKYFGGGYHSEISSPEFFLSKTGAISPKSELEATLKAFFEVPSEIEPNQHAQCRFKARFYWLRQVLDWNGLIVPSVSCPQFRKWVGDEEISSLSLVFATGYFESPASFYGHLLLKFNSKGKKGDVSISLLDKSVNFGAIVPEGENPIIYIVKGLLGGYGAAFSHLEFYHHNSNYAETELRDLWEYELDLSEEEVARIVFHVWELMGKQFTYFFIKENCAYQMAKLLELGIGESLHSQVFPWELPYSLVRRVAALERSGRPLLKDVKYHPSRQNKMGDKYALLNRSEKHAVKAWINSNNKHFNRLMLVEKKRVVETLFDYYEFLLKKEGDLPVYKEEKKKLLLERLKMSSGAVEWGEIREKIELHYGQPPSLVQMSLLQNSILGGGLEFRIKPAYNDFLSKDAGHLPYSVLSMVDLRLWYVNDRVRLRRLDIFNVETLNISGTHLPKDGGLAWKARLGVDSYSVACVDCLVVLGAAGFGKAASLFKKMVVYVEGDGRLQSEYQKSGTLVITPSLGSIMTPVSWWKMHLRLSRDMFINGSALEETRVDIESRFSINNTLDIRMDYSKNFGREFKLSLAYFW